MIEPPTPGAQIAAAPEAMLELGWDHQPPGEDGSGALEG